MKSHTKKYILVALIVCMIVALFVHYFYPFSALSMNKSIEVDQNKTTTRYKSNIKKLSANAPMLSENQKPQVAK